MTASELQILHEEIIKLIDSLENADAFALISKHQFFKGYRLFEDEFLYDRPEGLKYKHFQERLTTFVRRCIEDEIDKLLATTQPQASTQQDAETWYQKGRDATDKQEQINCFTQAILLNPAYKDAYKARGFALYDTRQYSAAIQDYTAALQQSEDYETYALRGAAYYYLSDYAKALADHNASIALNNSVAKVYEQRGTVYYYLEQYASSEADFDKAIQLEPKANFYKGRGNARYYLLRYEEAIEDYTQAIALEPTADNYWVRAFPYSQMGNKKGTLRDLAKAFELDSSKKGAAAINMTFQWLWEDKEFKALVRA